MIKFIKKMFTNGKSIEDRLFDIIDKQQQFIEKNINERVVYVDPQSGYTNVSRYDVIEKDNKDDDIFIEPEDVTPDMLRDIIEQKQAEE